MATYTPYLQLEKFTTGERLDVLKINANSDKIDNGVSALNSQIAIKSHIVQNVTTDTNASFNSGLMVADAIIVGVNATVGTGFISVAGVYNGEWVMQVRNFATGTLKTNANIGNIEILYHDR